MNLPNRLTLARVIAIPAIVALMMIGGRVCGLTAAVLFVAFSLFQDLMFTAKTMLGITALFNVILCLLWHGNIKTLYSRVMIMMVERALMPGWVLVVFVAREFIVSGLRLVAAGKGRVLAAGKLGKLKTASQMAALTVTLVGYYALDGQMTPWLSAVSDALIYVALVLAVWSGVDYLVRNREFIAQM